MDCLFSILSGAVPREFAMGLTDALDVTGEGILLEMLFELSSGHVAASKDGEGSFFSVSN